MRAIEFINLGEEEMREYLEGHFNIGAYVNLWRTEGDLPISIFSTLSGLYGMSAPSTGFIRKKVPYLVQISEYHIEFWHHKILLIIKFIYNRSIRKWGISVQKI